MMPPFDPVEKARLETLLDRANSHADNVEEQLWKSSVSIATEMTQYFEKVALGSGATIAAMVSFIGVHSGKLAPPYLLRSALVTLVVTMLTAMYRNWRYPRYVLVNYQEQQYSAKLNQERCKRDLFVAIPATSLQDGKPINPVEFAKYYEGIEKHLSSCIAKFQRIKTRLSTEVTWIGNFSLLCAVAGFAQLIALAWINF